MRNSYLAGLGLSAVAALGLPLASGTSASAAPLPASPMPTHVAAHKAHPRVTHARERHARHARTADASRPLTYTVRPGDSLWSIAHAHKVDWYNLAADNHLEMYNVIVPGQVLRLPARGEAPHAALPLERPSGTAPAPAATAAASPEPASGAGSGAPADSSPAAPASAPSTTAAAPQAPSSFEQCVISRESGGNPNAVNASGHWGLFQFSASTWSAYGGNPATFGSASAAQQQQVFNNAIAAGGASNWAPYDGC